MEEVHMALEKTKTSWIMRWLIAISFTRLLVGGAFICYIWALLVEVLLK